MMRFRTPLVVELTVVFGLLSGCADLVPATTEGPNGEPPPPTSVEITRLRSQYDSIGQLDLMTDLFAEPEPVQPIEREIVVSWEGRAPSFVLVTSLTGEQLAFETSFPNDEFRIGASDNLSVTIARFEPEAPGFSSVLTLLEVAPGQTIGWNDRVEPKTVHFQVRTSDLPDGTRLRALQSNCPALEFGALELSRYVAAEDCVRRFSADRGALIVAIAGVGQRGRDFFSSTLWQFGDTGFQFDDWREDWVSEDLFFDNLNPTPFIEAELRQFVPEDMFSDATTSWWSGFNSQRARLDEGDDGLLFDRLLPLDSVFGARLVVRDDERSERGLTSLLPSDDRGLVIDFNDLLHAEGELLLEDDEASWTLTYDGQMDTRTDCVAGRLTFQSPNLSWRFFGPPLNSEYRLPDLPAPFDVLNHGYAVGVQELTLVNVTQVEDCVELLLEQDQFSAELDPTYWLLAGQGLRWASISADF